MARISTLTVFCGSSAGRNPAHGAAAETFGRRCAERGIRIAFGGGTVGLMGTVARAAIDAGGRVVGVIPEFLMNEERARADLSELVVVKSMHERKARLFEMSDGFVALSGGLGTLDELIEVMTWRQLGLHDKPVVIVDVEGYWQPWFALTDALIAEGFASEKARDGAIRVTDVNAALEALEKAPEPRRRGHPGRL